MQLNSTKAKSQIVLCFNMLKCVVDTEKTNVHNYQRFRKLEGISLCTKRGEKIVVPKKERRVNTTTGKKTLNAHYENEKNESISFVFLMCV